MPNTKDSFPVRERLKTVLKVTMSGFRGFLQELEFLVVPLACAGCDRPDQELCRQCWTLLAAGHNEVSGEFGRIYTGPDFIGPLRNVIARWKDHGRSGLTPLIQVVSARHGRRLLVSLMNELKQER